MTKTNSTSVPNDECRMPGLLIQPSCWTGQSIWPAQDDREPDYATVWKRVGRSRSSFAFFFDPLLPLFNTLHWWAALEECPIVAPVIDGVADYSGLDKLAVHNSDWCFPPGTLFPMFTNQVIEDWVYLFGLTAKPPVTRFMGIDDFVTNEQCMQHFRIALLNMDGAFWYAFSNDSALLDQIRSHVDSLGPPFEAISADWSDLAEHG